MSKIKILTFRVKKFPGFSFKVFDEIIEEIRVGWSFPLSPLDLLKKIYKKHNIFRKKYFWKMMVRQTGRKNEWRQQGTGYQKLLFLHFTDISRVNGVGISRNITLIGRMIRIRVVITINRLRVGNSSTGD